MLVELPLLRCRLPFVIGFRICLADLGGVDTGVSSLLLI